MDNHHSAILNYGMCFHLIMIQGLLLSPITAQNTKELGVNALLLFHLIHGNQSIYLSCQCRLDFH